jgi:hypothetical protein
MSAQSLPRQRFRGARGGEWGLDGHDGGGVLHDQAFRHAREAVCADIRQIEIIKPGASIATSGFKRRNARDGLLEIVKTAGTTGKDKEERRSNKRARTNDSS